MKIHFIYLINFIIADLFRISYFDDPSVRLITNNNKQLSTSYIEPNKDKRFYFKIVKIIPGLLQLVSEDSNLKLTNENKLHFTDNNDKSTHFSIVLTENGGFKIIQDKLCLTLVSNDTLEMNKCSNNNKQIFMVLKENKSLLEAYSDVKYIYKANFKYQ